ncbi:MAG: 2-dehydropantoate 2-reductase [Candidatus Omnitrophota bacterium]
MKIAVIGSGAIGSLIAGYLCLKGEDVVLSGRREAVKEINKSGLKISGVRGSFNIKIRAAERLDFLADLVILATKTQDIEPALDENRQFLGGIDILITQNGLAAENLVTKYTGAEHIISSIVMFGSTYLNPGEVVHNFEGSWIIGRGVLRSDARLVEITGVLDKAFAVIVAEDIKGMKYLKVFINANNCIPAILGLSMQEVFLDKDISRIGICIWKEGLGLINKTGIRLASLPGFPLERITGLCALPLGEAAKIFSGIMLGLSKEPLYGSVLQSIKRKRPSEIDYINGEFVRIARENNLDAPLNEKLVEMVHMVEETKRFFSKEELVSATKDFVLQRG